MSNNIIKTLKCGMCAFAFFVLSSSLPAAQYKPLPVDGDGKLAPNSKFVSANGIVTASNLKKFRQDFRLFIDTTPSMRFDVDISTSSTLSNSYYYKDSAGKVQRTVSASGGALSSVQVSYKKREFKYWTDGEIKGIDGWGNLGLFTSTIALNNSQVLQLHPTLVDKTPKIFYWEITSGTNAAGGCWGVRRQLTNFNSSIGASIASNSCVSGIWIYPSTDSTEERAVPVYKGLNVLDTANYPKKGKGDNSSATNLAAGYKWVVWGEYVRDFLTRPDTTILCWRQTTVVGETYKNTSQKVWRPVRVEFYGDFKEIK